MNMESMRFSSPDGPWEVLGVYPDGEPRGMWKESLLLVLSEQTGEDAARKLMQEYDLERRVNTEKLLVIFPQCRSGCWTAGEGNTLSPDEKLVHALLMQAGGSPGGWGAGFDVHHLLGIDSGADVVCSLVAKQPSMGCAASVCAIGGTRELTGEGLSHAAVPAVLVDMPRSVVDYFCAANQVDAQEGARRYCSQNPAQSVTAVTRSTFQPERLWPDFCAQVRRINSRAEGDVVARNYRLPEHAVIRENVVLSDGLSHDWIEVPPPSVRAGKPDPVPLILISHGMGESPEKACESFGMHLIGEREGFLTVYAFSSNHRGWNLNLYEDQPDDVAYYMALIAYLKERYPIDSKRIYTTGFSNGAGMAMLFALMHPEVVAAACPVDSTFPYATMKFFNPARSAPYLTREDKTPQGGPIPSMDPDTALRPLRRALELQKEREHPLRLPVMYFYGSRESEYPIRAGSNQEMNYRFWKEFNGIPQGETDDTLGGTDAVGVPGMEIRILHPYAAHPEHTFSDHVFYNDEGLDAYHLVLMHGKAHDVHPCESQLGWDFVSRFSREPDGTLTVTEKV